MIKKIKELFKKKQPEQEVKKELIGISGHKFYALDGVPTASVNRFYYFISKSEEISTLGVPLDYYNAIADQLSSLYGGFMNEIAENKLIKDSKLITWIPKIEEAIRYANDKERLKWYWMTCAIVESFILIDDEPVKDISLHHNKIKLELLTKNPECRFFFINTAAEYLKTLETSYKDLNLEDYFKSLNIGESEILNTMNHLTSTHFGNFDLRPPEK